MNIKWNAIPVTCAGRKNFSISLAELRRLSPHEMPVDNIGYLAHSTKWAQWPGGGKDFSLSFIFGEPGICKIFGKKFKVVPPCIFTTWPEITMEFGPHKGRAWEEFYIGYKTDIMPTLFRRGLTNEKQPIWPIHDPAGARHGLAELYRLTCESSRYGQADRIDRLCDKLLTDTLLAHQSRLMPDSSEQIIRAVEAHVSANLQDKIDFQSLARSHGLSPTHFRRLWRRFFTVPPAHYVLQQRMREACRLLSETDMRINEVASQLGFKDELYFSKQFHRSIGLTATDYRRRKL